MMPRQIQEQVAEILDSNLTEEEVRRNYPTVIRWFHENVDLCDLIRGSGIQLRPVSPDKPGVLIGHGCPGCGGPVGVRR